MYYHVGEEYRNWHEHWFGNAIQPHVHIDTASLMEQFLQDSFWTILPESLAVRFCDKLSLTTRELSSTPPDRVCYMITNRRAPLKAMSLGETVARLLIDSLNEIPTITVLKSTEDLL